MGISDSLSEIKRSCDLTVPLVELLLSSFCVIYRRGCNEPGAKLMIPRSSRIMISIAGSNINVNTVMYTPRPSVPRY